MYIYMYIYMYSNMRASYLEYECFKYLIIISKLYMTFYTVILLISLVHKIMYSFFYSQRSNWGGGEHIHQFAFSSTNVFRLISNR